MEKLFIIILSCLSLTTCSVQKSEAGKQNDTELKAVEVNGYRLHYTEEGQGDPLIFVHGGLGTYKNWDSHMKSYANDYRAISYSRRYAYPNKQIFDESADYSVRIHAEDLYSFITKLNLEKVNIVAHSYGAFTAIMMALDHPEVVNSLILGEPPAGSLAQNTEKGRASWKAFLEDHLRPARQDFMAGKNEEAVVHFMQHIHRNFQLSDVTPEFREEFRRNRSEIWGIAMSEDFPALDEDKIESLDVPVLLLVGDLSPTFLIEITNELHSLLPNSEIARFDNMNHGLYFEQPEAVDEVINDFLNRN